MGDFADDYGGYDFYDRMELDEQRDRERRAQRAKLLTLPKQTGMLHIDRLEQWLDASLKERKQRAWVELSEERIREIWLRGKDHGDDWLDVLALARSFEAELKELNT
jgi:hypothetical protein